MPISGPTLTKKTLKLVVNGDNEVLNITPRTRLLDVDVNRFPLHPEEVTSLIHERMSR